MFLSPFTKLSIGKIQFANVNFCSVLSYYSNSQFVNSISKICYQILFLIESKQALVQGTVMSWTMWIVIKSVWWTVAPAGDEIDKRKWASGWAGLFPATGFFPSRAGILLQHCVSVVRSVWSGSPSKILLLIVGLRFEGFWRRKKEDELRVGSCISTL